MINRQRSVVAADPTVMAGLAVLTPPAQCARASAAVRVVARHWWSPLLADQHHPGQPVTFSAVVRNDGAAPTPEVTHRVGFGVDGSQVSWSSADSAPLAPGEQRTYTADGGPSGPTWTAVAGAHEVQVWVDDVDWIGETDEGNNTTTASLTVL